MESLKNDIDDVEEHPVVIRRRKRIRKDRVSKQTLMLKIIRVASLLLCLSILFCVGTLYSPWTGIWGTSVGNSLLGSIGGAVAIPLLFLLYIISAKMTGKKIPAPFRQTSGTVFLFLCTVILFGLIDITNFSAPACFSPGVVGKWLTGILLESSGALGTLFISIFFIVLSLFFYGFLDIKAEDIYILIDRLKVKLRSFVLKHDKRKIPPIDDLDSEYTKTLSIGVTAEEEKFLILSPKDRTEEKQLSEVQNQIVTEVTEVTEVTIPEDKNSVKLHEEFVPEVEIAEQEATSDLNQTKEENLFPLETANEEEIFEAILPDTEEIIDAQVIPEQTVGKTDINETCQPEKVLPKSVILNQSEENIDEEPLLRAPFPPSLELFGPEEISGKRNDPTLLKQKGLDIITALSNFGVEAVLANTVEGPTVIQYQLQLAPGIKVSKISSLNKDIAVALAVPSLRVEAPIPNTSYVGIEIPNRKRRSVTLRSMLETSIFKNSELLLPLPVGYRVDGTPMVIGLEELPHLLVAGTTGSGKSVFVTSCITALCYKRTPAELRLMLIDPKRVEMAIYENLPHVLSKPIVDPQKAIHALGWAVREMERRYEVFANARVRQLSTYNERVIPKDRLPHIVIVVDELADLMFTASKEVEDFICRLAQMARATGIHLILATQRPSVNVVTGLIKANIPARAAFTLPSQTDSRTIINTSGAQQLLGKGDMLFTSTKNPRPVRIQSPFIDEDTSLDVINAMRRSFGDPEYVELEDQQNGRENGKVNHIDDERLEEAIRMVLQTGIASASRLQRQMRVGFTRAARLVDTMEQMGIVGPQEGSKPREIYVDEERADEILEEYFH